MTFPDKKYNIIYADPPWKFNNGIRSSKKIDGKYQYYTPETTVGAGRYASVMTTSEIMALPVADIAQNDCALFLWTTDSHLPAALRVIEAWGFTYRTVGFVWNKKEKSGKQVCYMGKWTMKGSEICLIGAKGKANSLIVDRTVRQLVEAQRGIHSQKPDEVRKRIVQMFGDLPRIELFARQTAEGWDSWGNEV